MLGVVLPWNSTDELRTMIFQNRVSVRFWLRLSALQFVDLISI
jgi:hypothetical protein